MHQTENGKHPLYRARTHQENKKKTSICCTAINNSIQKDFSHGSAEHTHWETKGERGEGHLQNCSAFLINLTPPPFCLEYRNWIYTQYTMVGSILGQKTQPRNTNLPVALHHSGETPPNSRCTLPLTTEQWKVSGLQISSANRKSANMQI